MQSTQKKSTISRRRLGARAQPSSVAESGVPLQQIGDDSSQHLQKDVVLHSINMCAHNLSSDKENAQRIATRDKHAPPQSEADGGTREHLEPVCWEIHEIGTRSLADYGSDSDSAYSSDDSDKALHGIAPLR